MPHAHGFKSVKWLQHITVTNDYRTGDTYATIDDLGNDPVSYLKTYASIVSYLHVCFAGSCLKASWGCRRARTTWSRTATKKC